MQSTNKLKIQVLIDNPNSWIIPYANNLINELRNIEHDVSFISSHQDVISGDILFLLGCTKIFKKLGLNKHNIVVHESELPKGKGWSPLTWQILEGKNEITITLFEAVQNVDSGKIYLQDKLIFEGHELIDELREKQGKKTVELCVEFVRNYFKIGGIEQKGSATFYEKRTPLNSELDANKTINEQFNLLRVVDNERYPAFFFHNDKKYIIKIYKEDEDN